MKRFEKMQNFNMKKEKKLDYFVWNASFFSKARWDFFFYEHYKKIVVETATTVETAGAEVCLPPTDRTKNKKLSEKKTSKSREYFNE